MDLTEFAQAMLEKHRISGNPVQAYRTFSAGEKSKFATWKRRPIPKWFEAKRDSKG